MREALRRLEAEGLVVNEVHRGATVVRPSDENKAEVYGIRAALEPYVARLAELTRIHIAGAIEHMRKALSPHRATAQ